MPNYTAQNWKNMGLIPTSGLLAWHMYEAAVSGHNSINDYSGNNLHIFSGAGNSAVLQSNIINGQPAWYFNGSRDPLATSSSATQTVKHVFFLISHEDATFNELRGVLSGKTTNAILVSNNTDDTFFDPSVFGYGTTEYRKNDTVFANNNAKAPMSGAFALVELSFATGASLDGFQVGQQTNLTARKWKGWFVEQQIYNRVLSQAERERVMLYYNVKFALWKQGVPLIFPSSDIVGYGRSRFYAAPQDWQKITDSYEFEDGGKTFNEVSSVAPQRWEYEYLGKSPDEANVFDAFDAQARRANPFKFRDKYGTLWDNVRIERYERTHDKHKSWSNDVKFDLVKYS